MTDEVKKIKRTFKGIVVSDKNDKTIIVKVERVKMHPKYHKRYTVSKNYKAHDEKNEYKIGDKVIIQECRPLSRDKRWRVIGKFGQGIVADEIEEKELAELDSAKEVERIEKKVEEAEASGEEKETSNKKLETRDDENEGKPSEDGR